MQNCEWCFEIEENIYDCTNMWCDNYDWSVMTETMRKAADFFARRAEEEYRRKNRIPEPPPVEALERPKVEEERPELAPPPHESVYELTLTTTKDDPYELRGALEKIVKSFMFEVVAWEACIELQQNGFPHIHAVIYSSRKYCDGTKIRTVQKFPYRYTFSRVKHLPQFLLYIKKEKNNAQVIDYCLLKGIPQFWCNEK